MAVLRRPVRHRLLGDRYVHPAEGRRPLHPAADVARRTWRSATRPSTGTRCTRPTCRRSGIQEAYPGWRPRPDARRQRRERRRGSSAVRARPRCSARDGLRATNSRTWTGGRKSAPRSTPLRSSPARLPETIWSGWPSAASDALGRPVAIALPAAGGPVVSPPGAIAALELPEDPRHGGGDDRRRAGRDDRARRPDPDRP